MCMLIYTLTMAKGVGMEYVCVWVCVCMRAVLVQAQICACIQKNIEPTRERHARSIHKKIQPKREKDERSGRWKSKSGANEERANEELGKEERAKAERELE